MPVRRSEVAGRIYGQILVTSLVVVLSEDKGASAGEAFGAVVTSLIVFWLAHAYAELVGERVSRGGRISFDELRAVAVHEGPILIGAIPSLLALLLGWAGALSRTNAENLAIAVGVLMLSVWGYIVARRSRLTPVGTIISVALAAALGVALVALKVIVH